MGRARERIGKEWNGKERKAKESSERKRGQKIKGGKALEYKGKEGKEKGRKKWELEVAGLAERVRLTNGRNGREIVTGVDKIKWTLGQERVG